MANYGNYGNYGNQRGGGGGGGGDFSTTSYGAQGGADGGGFMGGSQPQGSQQGRSKYGSDTLRPCTILQIQSAYQPHPDADFKLDNTELDIVSIIGQIRNVSKQATKTTYLLDDGTGTMNTIWVDIMRSGFDEAGNPLPPTENEALLEVGKWAKCFGKLKSFGNKRHVGALAIRPIKDMNEINYHLLEATAVHLYFARGQPELGPGGHHKSEEQSLFMQQNDGGGGQKSTAGLGPGARKVYQWLHNAPRSNEGYHSQIIAAAIGLSHGDVMKAGDELLGGSFIYTTVDDNTWSILDD